MAHLLQRGADWLASKLKASESHLVTYVRGTERVSLWATFGQTEYQVYGDSGIKIEYTDRDFIVRAADLILSGELAKPRAGDQIEELVRGELHTYEVMVLTGEDQPFRYCDFNRVMIRIHTKLIKLP